MKVFAFVSEGQEEEKNMLENIQSIIEHAGSTGNLLMTHGFEPVTEAFGIRFYPARRKVIMDGIQIEHTISESVWTVAVFSMMSAACTLNL